MPEKYNEIRVVLDTCNCEFDCDCTPFGHFEINGKKGSGLFDWTLDPKTGHEEFSCSFLGRNFTASSRNDIMKKISNMMSDFHGIVVC